MAKSGNKKSKIDFSYVGTYLLNMESRFFSKNPLFSSPARPASAFSISPSGNTLLCSALFWSWFWLLFSVVLVKNLKIRSKFLLLKCVRFAFSYVSNNGRVTSTKYIVTRESRSDGYRGEETCVPYNFRLDCGYLLLFLALPHIYWIDRFLDFITLYWLLAIPMRVHIVTQITLTLTYKQSH